MTFLMDASIPAKAIYIWKLAKLPSISIYIQVKTVVTSALHQAVCSGHQT